MLNKLQERICCAEIIRLHCFGCFTDWHIFSLAITPTSIIAIYNDMPLVFRVFEYVLFFGKVDVYPFAIEFAKRALALSSILLILLLIHNECKDTVFRYLKRKLRRRAANVPAGPVIEQSAQLRALIRALPVMMEYKTVKVKNCDNIYYAEIGTKIIQINDRSSIKDSIDSWLSQY